MIKLQFITVFLVALLIWLGYVYQVKNLPRPLRYRAGFSGSPYYIAGSTSGSPLSELGSHCGFKAVLEKKAAACSALHATVTSFGAGRLYNFAFCLYGESGEKFFRKSAYRKVHFTPCCIEERAEDRGWKLRTRLFFLQRNLAVLQAEIEAGEKPGETGGVQPAFLLLSPGGRDIENPYPHFKGRNKIRQKGDGLLLSSSYRYFGLKMWAYFLPSSGGCGGKKELRGEKVYINPGEKTSWSVIISFSPGGDPAMMERAVRALRRLPPLAAAAEKRWSLFELRLPVPRDREIGKGNDAVKLFRLAAWALENNLYAPRNSMRRWGSVPSKVYFPFIWGWDTPQHVLGLGEWNPPRAAEVLLTQLEGNNVGPTVSPFRLKLKGITLLSGPQKHQIPSKIDDSLKGVLNFYSQPPLQSWAAVRTYQQFAHPAGAEDFLHTVQPLLKQNLRWWEDNRCHSSGFFSYINGLESGLDDSPRFYPRSLLPSFIIGLMPRFLSAVDLNCWMYQSYLNLAYLSREAGLPQDFGEFHEKAEKLREKIDRELWSPEENAWLDRHKGKLVRVFTPAIWWPAFLGATRDLARVKTVIEKYLLQPGKFWGKYGIPSVSFDDATYNSLKEGYYWRGQVWMINNYSALEVLFRFGYQEEAAELHRRIINNVLHSAGLYETYNAETGAVGWSSRGPGDPAVMQFGMTSAWITQILLCRYQRFRYIFPETMELKGRIQWASTFDEEEPVYSPPGAGLAPEKALLKLHPGSGDGFNIPWLHMKSADGKPLLQASRVKVCLEEAEGTPEGEKTGELMLTWKEREYQLHTGQEFLLNI